MIFAFILRYNRAFIALGLLLAMAVALRLYVADAIHDDRLESTIEAQQRDAVADDRAGQVAASEAATIEQENVNARKVAAGSDDPLKSGFDSLRANKAGDH